MHKDKQVLKIDSYDFFGYLMPGLIVFLAAFVAFQQIVSNCTQGRAITIIQESAAGLSTTVFSAASALIILGCYLIGHLSSSISSFFFDKMLVRNVLGYPFQMLLFDDNSNWDYRSSAYRAYISSTLLSIFFYVFGFKIPIMVVTIDYSHLLYLLFALLILQGINGQIFRHLPVALSSNTTHWMHLVYKIVAVPFWLSEFFAVQFLGLTKTFPPAVKDRIQDKFNSIFKMPLSATLASESYWAVYWYVTSSNQYLRIKIDKWLVLYGFMRNTSCAALLASIILSVPSRNYGITSEFNGLAAKFLYISARVFSFRYYYLYFGYYTKTIFRAFAFIEFEENKDTANAEHD